MAMQEKWLYPRAFLHPRILANYAKAGWKIAYQGMTSVMAKREQPAGS